MKRLLILSLALLLCACAGSQKTVKNPSDKASVLSKVYEVKSEFGEHRIYGPVIEGGFGGLLHNDKISIQLMKTESDNYYIRIHNFHSGKGWKFIQSITTVDKETIQLQDLSQETNVCLSEGCSFTEIGFAPISKSKYLSGTTDLKIRINAKRWGTQVMVIPKQYIQAFIEKAG
ncbi:MAG: hypothetical protein IPN27_00010 [Cellvibrionales bacterium]|jgi:hypothetical protein|nr:hypothetical protein [Cellvibrionales bacterium]